MVQLGKVWGTLIGSWLADEALTWSSLSSYPLAVCTDGSPSGYYWRRGVNNSHTWLVYLAGGNWCHNKADCLARCPRDLGQATVPYLCSSRDLPKTLNLGGVFTPSNPSSALAGANQVFIQYCTSDAHMGDGEAFGLQFRGARVVESVFKDLVMKRGLAQGARELVVLGGTSAGARGAMVNLDYVRRFLHKANAPGAANVEVVGFLDSPLWVDIPPMSTSGFYGFRKSCRSVQGFANVTHLGDHCMQAFPAAQRFKCIMAQYRLQYLETPYFMVASQYDAFQLINNLGSLTGSQEQYDYIGSFARRTLNLVRDLLLQSPRNAIYVPACFTHARTLDDNGYNHEKCSKDNVSVDDAFNMFLHRTASSLHWIDDCTSFNCGRGCPSHSKVLSKSQGIRRPWLELALPAITVVVTARKRQ
mmetsp:Transcript_32350/g.75085  ORF Transcript_32350/g.75085 Transcript_32350/m.75085 type:complete len:417 (-) Transcript_32350:37-1287(-)